jgi:nicotinamidase-related amidase
MAVTKLDPKSALIVIDLQKGLAMRVPEATFAPVVAKSRALADAFRARDMPVVLVAADGVAPGRTEQSRSLGNLPPDFAEVVDEMAPQASDIVLRKQTWGVFASTDLEARLKALGVTQVVVTGVATSAGVESTARQAYEAGFNVTIALDAVADLRPEAHAASITLIFPRLGETGSTDDILALLGQA